MKTNIKNRQRTFSKDLKYIFFLILFIYGSGIKAQWIPVNTGIAMPGNARALASDGTNIYAGLADSLNGGIYISADLGNSWTAINNGLPSLNVWDLETSGPNVFACVINYGVYMSTNHGNSWTAINTGLSTLFVRAVMIKDTTIYAATNQGVFKSSLTGSYYWTAVNSGLSSLDIITFAFHNDDVFVGTAPTTATNGGVYLSGNGGTSWTAVNSGGFTDLETRALITQGSVILAGMGMSTHLTPADVYSSVNSGPISWTSSSTGMTSGAEILSFHAINTNIFAGGAGNNFYYSHTNGASWSSWSTGLSGGTIFSQTSVGSTLFIADNGFGGGFYKRDTNELNVGVQEITALAANMDVYPNSFNMVTTISYQLKKNASVELSVKDITGKTIAVLETDQKPEGSYSISWNAEGIDAGIYMVQLKAGGQLLTKKIIVTK